MDDPRISAAQAYSDAYMRSRDAVKAARRRLDDVRAQSSKVRADLRGIHSEHRAILERNREELIALQKTAAFAAVGRSDRFAAVVSHELRQPLNAAIAAAELLYVGQNPDRALGVLRRQLLRMAELLDVLIDMSRIAMKTVDLDLRRVSLRRALERATETLEPAIVQKQLTLTMPDGLAALVVFADEQRLVQVFSNLISNAVRYTPAGGRIAIAVQADDRAVTIEIQDSGKGISPDELQTIFEPFVRGTDSGQEGLGIGLAMVRGLVELHGGTVSVRSDGPGHGSSFIVSLPRMLGAESGAVDD
jgi:signal transduction histidine kinase